MFPITFTPTIVVISFKISIFALVNTTLKANSEKTKGCD